MRFADVASALAGDDPKRRARVDENVAAVELAMSRKPAEGRSVRESLTTVSQPRNSVVLRGLEGPD